MPDQTAKTKKAAAEKAVKYIEDGMTIGLGTGSTAYWAIQLIGKRVREGLHVKAIATSKHSETLARELGIPIISFADTDQLDITIDGADETDHSLNLIKGGGGALLREKIVAAVSKFYIIIADESKLVKTLGAYPLPVEIVQFGYEVTLSHLKKLGCTPKTRSVDGKFLVTDNGNFIADCEFGSIENAEELNHQINAIPGVVDNGLFINMADIVILGGKDGSLKEIKKAEKVV
jgi:ribose 5-phosphate isomerase A